ncbi:Ig-like domain-containing protein, partial [Pseudomonas guariconensis]|uniref:Ig-like domain-containing protein n=1 Tax=Pseudomonas guariconensis TaxID=1288410 RepID=UPI0034D4E5B9
PGIYEAKLSGTKADSWTVSPVLDSITLGIEGKVDLTPGALDAGSSDFLANPNTIVAGSGKESELKLTAKDAHGNLVPGIAGDLEFEVIDSKGVAAGADVTIKDLQETTPGIYTAKLTGTRVETWSVTPLYKKTRLGTLTKQVDITTAAPVPGNSTFTASPTSGYIYLTTVNLQFEARDGQNQPMTGLADKLKFVVKSDSQGRPLEPNDVIISAIRENTPGIYTATFRAGLGDDHTIVPLFEGADIGTLSQMVAIQGGHGFANAYSNTNPHSGENAPRTAFKGASFYYRISSETDQYDATIESAGPWLTKTGSTSFRMIELPKKGESATIRFTRNRGNHSFTHTFKADWLYIPSDDKLPYSQAKDACMSKGYVLADGGVYSDRLYGLWGNWGDLTRYRESNFRGEQYWYRNMNFNIDSPALFNARTGETTTKSVDPTTPHYYICIPKTN